jgi:hypothetical protein
MGVKRTWHTQGTETWGFYCLLRIHPKLNHIKEGLKVCPRLIVASGAAPGHERLAILKRDIRHQRGAWPLSRFQSICMVRIEVEGFNPMSYRTAQSWH